MDAIRGADNGERYIKDGYQYVGGFPAHLWKLATADDHYKTLSYGISDFDDHWQAIRKKLATPFHYVSIGPGTGEKDQVILRHLASLTAAETIVYVPVDISPQLLRMSMEVAMRGVDRSRVELLPVELDITNDDALAALKIVIEGLGGGTNILVSLLGNTLANFRDDSEMLVKIFALIASKENRLLLEVATTDNANEFQANRAAGEYERSKLFREFAMAALCDYTNIPMDPDLVKSSGEFSDDTLYITTRFIADKQRAVQLGNGETFKLEKGEPIKLYTSRKYADNAVKSLLSGLSTIATHASSYSRGFGIATYLLSQDVTTHDTTADRPGDHPVGKT